MNKGHRLFNCHLKIKRAKKDFDDLRRIDAAFMASKPYGIASQYEPQTGETVWKVRVSQDVPDEYAVAVGVVAHSLRSAFDLLAGHLKLTGQGPPVLKHEFPIYWIKDRYESEGRRKIKGASHTVMQLVENLQPYKRGKAFADDPMYLIHHLDITDKHRDIVYVGAGIPHHRFQLGPRPGTNSLFIDKLEYRRPSMICPLEDGAEVIRYRFTDPNVNMNAEYGFAVAFYQSEIGKGQAVIPTLKQLIDFSEGVIESFRPAVERISV